jgi:hypothetical protein
VGVSICGCWLWWCFLVKKNGSRPLQGQTVTGHCKFRISESQRYSCSSSFVPSNPEDTFKTSPSRHLQDLTVRKKIVSPQSTLSKPLVWTPPPLWKIESIKVNSVVTENLNSVNFCIDQSKFNSNWIPEFHYFFFRGKRGCLCLVGRSDDHNCVKQRDWGTQTVQTGSCQ